MLYSVTKIFNAIFLFYNCMLNSITY